VTTLPPWWMARTRILPDRLSKFAKGAAIVKSALARTAVEAPSPRPPREGEISRRGAQDMCRHMTGADPSAQTEDAPVPKLRFSYAVHSTSQSIASPRLSRTPFAP